jgi:hypothetical protein
MFMLGQHYLTIKPILLKPLFFVKKYLSINALKYNWEQICHFANQWRMVVLPSAWQQTSIKPHPNLTKRGLGEV